MPLLSVADLFLLPSAQESFGLAALEAMACEVPVVASRVGGLPEVIEDGVTGFLRAPDDLDGMAAAGIRAADRPSRSTSAWPRAARARGRERFCDTRIVPMYEAYYDEILRARQSGHGRAGQAGREKAEWRDQSRSSNPPALPALPDLPACKIARYETRTARVRRRRRAARDVCGAQMRVVPVDEQQGHVALGLALRHLANTGIFMKATAHPDDENNGLLVMLNRGQGYRTALATATRGNGGQNEIGPEIFEALGVLRTEELAALHRFDGAEQYFTRAVDFGYSFSIDETFEKWGKDEIIGDYVRLIRMIRPDVIIAHAARRADSGGQHHKASAVLSHEAYKLAGDPTKYPEQIKDGLRPWQPKKFYYIAPASGSRRAADASARS